MKNIFRIIIVFLLAAFLVSCEEEYNQWNVEPGHERLFKSLVFGVSSIKSTSVELKFTKSLSATKYIFEFSKDSLEFLNIDHSVELLAGNLTPFASSTNAVRVEYREIFYDLDGTTKYSVRMKSVDENSGLESAYSQLYFVTPAEQIITGYVPTSNSVTVTWTISDRITNVGLYTEESELVENIFVTAEQKAAGMVTFENLFAGTTYIAKIFNENNNRGTINVKTNGILNSHIYKVLTTDKASSITTALTDLVEGGATDITVEFEAGVAYSIGGTITIPTGTNNIAFIGSKDENGQMSSLDNVKWIVKTVANDITFQYLSFTSAGGFAFDHVGTKTIHDISFEGCNILNVNSIVRMRTGSTANSINVNNCLVSQTGNYGMINASTGDLTLGSINVANCTLTEISTRFADVRVVTEINFKNITCINVNMSMTHLWNFDNNKPPQVQITNCIIAGPNGGVKLNSTAGNYSNISIGYNTNYKTVDLLIDARPLTQITELPLTYDQLFVDPDNGDYHIKEGTGFAGTGVAGDARWFE